MAGLRIDVCLPKPRCVHLSGPTRHPVAPEVETTELKKLNVRVDIHERQYICNKRIKSHQTEQHGCVVYVDPTRSNMKSV
jgi:hypothetical protein